MLPAPQILSALRSNYAPSSIGPAAVVFSTSQLSTLLLAILIFSPSSLPAPSLSASQENASV